MREYEDRESMERALIAQVVEGVEGVDSNLEVLGSFWVSADSRIVVRHRDRMWERTPSGSTQSHDLTQEQYHVCWHSDASGVATLTLMCRQSAEAGVHSLARAADAQTQIGRHICQALRGFQAAYWHDEVRYEFHGFGVGLDEEYHRKVCELAGASGTITASGTKFCFREALLLDVPHPFFREKGMGIESTVIGKTHRTAGELQAYMETLRRAGMMVELIERAS